MKRFDYMNLFYITNRGEKIPCEQVDSLVQMRVDELKIRFIPERYRRNIIEGAEREVLVFINNL